MIRRRGLLGTIVLTIVVHGLYGLVIRQDIPQAIARNNDAAPLVARMIEWQSHYVHVRMRNHVRLEQGIAETARHGQDAAHAALEHKTTGAFNARHFQGIVIETVVDRQALGSSSGRCGMDSGTVQRAAAAAVTVSIDDARIPHIGRGHDNFRRGFEYLYIYIHTTAIVCIGKKRLCENKDEFLSNEKWYETSACDYTVRTWIRHTATVAPDE
jgi:hypothetical protein